MDAWLFGWWCVCVMLCMMLCVIMCVISYGAIVCDVLNFVWCCVWCSEWWVMFCVMVCWMLVRYNDLFYAVLVWFQTDRLTDEWMDIFTSRVAFTTEKPEGLKVTKMMIDWLMMADWHFVLSKRWLMCTMSKRPIWIYIRVHHAISFARNDFLLWYLVGMDSWTYLYDGVGILLRCL